MSSKKNIIITILPQAGIGNKLSVWSRGFIFSKLNNLELVVFGWVNLRLRNWVKLKYNKRNYFNYFTSLSYSTYFKVFICLFFQRKKINPKINDEAIKRYNYIYYRYDYDFFDLVPHRDLIIKSKHEILSRRLISSYYTLKTPSIGIHIRRDDFLAIGYATPLSFYINILNKVRAVLSMSKPVTIFSDGSANELEELTSLPNVSLASKKEDILDLFELSKSKLLVTSVGSSFSYWASFLNDGITINSDKEWRRNLKGNKNDSYSSEWYINPDQDLPLLLQNQIKTIFL